MIIDSDRQRWEAGLPYGEVGDVEELLEECSLGSQAFPVARKRHAPRCIFMRFEAFFCKICSFNAQEASVVRGA